MKKVLFLFVALMALSFTSQAQLLASFTKDSKGVFGLTKLETSNGPVGANQGLASINVDPKSGKLTICFTNPSATLVQNALTGKLYIPKDISIPADVLAKLQTANPGLKISGVFTAGSYALTHTGKNYCFTQN